MLEPVIVRRGRPVGDRVIEYRARLIQGLLLLVSAPLEKIGSVLADRHPKLGAIQMGLTSIENPSRYGIVGRRFGAMAVNRLLILIDSSLRSVIPELLAVAGGLF